MLKAGIVQGWIEFYTVRRVNKRGGKVTVDGKVIPAEREYEYPRLMAWDPESCRERLVKHLSQPQFREAEAGINRRRRVEAIDRELRQLGGV